MNLIHSLVLSLLMMTMSGVDGHGRILDPPGRASIWRFGYSVSDAPLDYDDNGLFCGGYQKQFNNVNNGRCGECGDEWSLPRPRYHEEGGAGGYGKIIGQTYTEGQVIRATVELTANHMGYFQFKLCAKKSAEELPTQECFDRNVLTLFNQTTTKYQVRDPLMLWHFPVLQLPKGLTCDRCVMQWTYTTGNSWGVCDDGTGAVGCGDKQETFRNCADVAIFQKPAA